jgi:methyl coenzyme M reductase gamma subunit
MKQIIFIFCMILMLSFCGCTNVGSNRNEYMSNWFKSEQEISDNMMKQIIDLYNEGKNLKNCFHKTVKKT